MIHEQIKEIVHRIVENYKPEKIVLFGSYAYGHPSQNSDLDLLIIKESNLPRYKRAREIRPYLWEVTNISMDIIVYTPKEIEEWENVEEAFITTVVKNGKVLYEDKRGFNKRLA